MVESQVAIAFFSGLSAQGGARVFTQPRPTAAVRDAAAKIKILLIALLVIRGSNAPSG